AVESDSSQARFKQWQKCAEEIADTLKGVRLPPLNGDGPEIDPILPEPQRKAIRGLRGRVDPAVETTRNRLESDLRLDHFYGPMNQSVEDCLTELCKRAVEGLPGASKKSAREGAVKRFHKVVVELPDQLDPTFDAGIEAFVARLKELLTGVWEQVLDPAGYAD